VSARKRMRRGPKSGLDGMYGLVPDMMLENFGVTPEKNVQPPKSREVKLTRYKLATQSERDALRRLKPKYGASANVHNLVLAYLALIADTIEFRRPQPRSGSSRSEYLRYLKRRVGRVRKFARYLETDRGWPGSLAYIDSGRFHLVRELYSYADHLEARAESLSSPSEYAGVPIADVLHSHSKKRQPPRRSERPESHLITDLMQFVLQSTGQPHRPELALLLQRPCEDEGITAKRLDSHWNFRSTKRRRSGSRLALAFYRASFPRVETPRG
jgi:hypothetical protein